jgi:hypothetical protein
MLGLAESSITFRVVSLVVFVVFSLINVLES